MHPRQYTMQCTHKPTYIMYCPDDEFCLPSRIRSLNNTDTRKLADKLVEEFSRALHSPMMPVLQPHADALLAWFAKPRPEDCDAKILHCTRKAIAAEVREGGWVEERHTLPAHGIVFVS